MENFSKYSTESDTMDTYTPAITKSLNVAAFSPHFCLVKCCQSQPLKSFIPALLCVCVQVHTCMHTHAQPCLILCNHMDYSPPGSSVHEIFQAGILEWVAISSSNYSSVCTCKKARMTSHKTTALCHTSQTTEIPACGSILKLGGVFQSLLTSDGRAILNMESIPWQMIFTWLRI